MRMKNVLDERNKLREENKDLQTKWNNLREWLKGQIEDTNKCIEWNKKKNQHYEEYERDIKRFEYILNKMNELEGNINKNNRNR